MSYGSHLYFPLIIIIRARKRKTTSDSWTSCHLPRWGMYSLFIVSVRLSGDMCVSISCLAVILIQWAECSMLTKIRLVVDETPPNSSETIDGTFRNYVYTHVLIQQDVLILTVPENLQFQKYSHLSPA